MNGTHRTGALRRVGLLIPALALAIGLAGCETDVINPGPVQDDFLDDRQAHSAMVAGMGRALSAGVNWLSYTGAAVTREIHPSGSTGSFGITNRWQRGELSGDDDDLDTHWEQAQRARWLAEDGIRRMEEIGPASDSLIAQAYLFAGYANRLLGEHYCQAVISLDEPGSPEDHTAFFTRAESFFEQAVSLAVADRQRMAARAGLASVRASLGDWDGAAAEAALVTDNTFEYAIPYHDIGEDAQRNRIQFASHSQPYRAHTQWSTKYETVALSDNNPAGDPRIPYVVTDSVGDAAIDCCGNVPWWPQDKYGDPGADIALSSYEEMRLIEAEAALDDGDWQTARDIIDALRTDAGVAPSGATNEEETWTALKNERGIVLWLEGRRIGDMRRWDEAGRPGAYHPLERPSADPSTGSHLAQQDLCFPIPPTEQETNPNVPTV